MNSTCIIKFIFILLTIFYAVNCEGISLSPNQTIFEENDEVALTCKPEIEPGYCKWFRGRQKINNDTSNRYQINAAKTCVLKITSLSTEDDSFWYCNPQNSSLSFGILLNVEIKEIVQLIPTEAKSIHVEEGQTADLQCQFNSSAPSCYWLKGSEMIDIRGRYQYIGNKNEGNCTIRIDKVNWRDDGQWQCCYPIVDKWPAKKSPIITLSITVAPPTPIITVNGIKVGNKAEIFISTTFTRQSASNLEDNTDHGYESYEQYPYEERPYNPYSRPTEPEISNKLNDTILCWSRNGFPAAQLSWKMEDEYGTHLQYVDANNNFPNTWNSVSSQNLKTSNVELRLDRDKFDGIQRTKLMCIATHPSYYEEHKITYIWLTWANKINYN